MSEETCEWSLSLEVIPGAEKRCALGGEYINTLLRDVFEDEEFNTLVLEDFNYEYERFLDPFGFLTIYGGVKLEKGILQGLKTLHQAGDCCLSESDCRLRVDSLLACGVLNFEYDCSPKFMMFGTTVRIQGHLDYVEILFDVSVDSMSGRNAKLHKFELNNCKGFRIDMVGSSPLNYFASSLLNRLYYMFEDYVIKQLEKKIKNYLETRLPCYTFPSKDTFSSDSIELESD